LRTSLREEAAWIDGHVKDFTLQYPAKEERAAA
jgi:hypothetical protein